MIYNKEVLKSCLVKLTFICLLASTVFAKYSGGSGTEADPYLIATPQDMNTIGADSNDWSKHFKMIADVNLAAYTGTEFKLIGTQGKQFLGVFDGNGHDIMNFTYVDNNMSSYKGLFGHIGTGGTISNLTMKNVNVSVSKTIYFGA